MTFSGLEPALKNQEIEDENDDEDENDWRRFRRFKNRPDPRDGLSRRGRRS
jgi:hypothetical protein